MTLATSSSAFSGELAVEPANQAPRPMAAAMPWVQRLSLAAGGLTALGLAPSEAQAAIVYVTTPITAITNGLTGINNVGWDVDGISGNDFTLFWNNAAGAGGLIALGDNEVIANTANVPYPGSYFPLNLALAVNVGPTPPGVGGWGPVGSNILYGPPLNNAQLATAASPNAGLQIGQNYFGFRFGSPGNYNYGWAQLNLSLNGDGNGNPSLTISRWAYNNTPDGPITVGDTGTAAVPGPLGLAGLAAGAAWSRKLRRRIREAA